MSKNQSKKPPEIDLWFDRRDEAYWYLLNASYTKLSTRNVRLHLQATHELRDDPAPSEWKAPGLREIDFPLWNAQMKKQIGLCT